MNKRFFPAFIATFLLAACGFSDNSSERIAGALYKMTWSKNIPDEYKSMVEINTGKSIEDHLVNCVESTISGIGSDDRETIADGAEILANDGAEPFNEWAKDNSGHAMTYKMIVGKAGACMNDTVKAQM